tara:strand:+ start:267 stop:449 length:183 start_codon:yes stop_codon:yes gene_type:complete
MNADSRTINKNGIFGIMEIIIRIQISVQIIQKNNKIIDLNSIDVACSTNQIKQILTIELT